MKRPLCDRVPSRRRGGLLRSRRRSEPLRGRLRPGLSLKIRSPIWVAKGEMLSNFFRRPPAAPAGDCDRARPAEPKLRSDGRHRTDGIAQE